MRRIFIAVLISISILITAGCANQNKNFNSENEKIEEVNKFEAIGCYRFKDNETGLYGYIDGKGKVIIEPIYKKATDFEYGSYEYAKAYDDNETVTIIDKKGKEYLPFGKYTSLSLPKSDLIVFKEDTLKYGVVDINDNIILEPIYDQIEIGDLGSIIVTLNNKNGVFDSSGNIILDIVYDYIHQFKDSFIVKKDDKDGLFNIEGKEIIPIEYEDVQIAHSIGKYDKEVFRVINTNEKIGFFDNSGDQLTDFIYDEFNAGRDGLIPVRKDNKWGYIDMEGNIAIPFEFDYAYSFAEGKSIVQINDEKKYINTKGEFIEEEEVNYEFENEKYIISKENNKYKLVNENGEDISDTYTNMSLFNNNITASNEDISVLMDLKGNMLAEYKLLVSLGPNLFMASDTKDEIKMRLIDIKGNIVSNDIYLYALYYEEFNKIVAVKENGQYSILNENGEKILDIDENANDVKLFEEDLIRVEFNEENFKWINSKGDILA